MIEGHRAPERTSTCATSPRPGKRSAAWQSGHWLRLGSERSVSGNALWLARWRMGGQSGLADGSTSAALDLRHRSAVVSLHALERLGLVVRSASPAPHPNPSPAGRGAQCGCLLGVPMPSTQASKPVSVCGEERGPSAEEAQRRSRGTRPKVETPPFETALRASPAQVLEPPAAVVRDAISLIRCADASMAPHHERTPWRPSGWEHCLAFKVCRQFRPGADEWLNTNGYQGTPAARHAHAWSCARAAQGGHRTPDPFDHGLLPAPRSCDIASLEAEGASTLGGGLAQRLDGLHSPYVPSWAEQGRVSGVHVKRPGAFASAGYRSTSTRSPSPPRMIRAPRW